MKNKSHCTGQTFFVIYILTVLLGKLKPSDCRSSQEALSLITKILESEKDLKKCSILIAFDGKHIDKQSSSVSTSTAKHQNHIQLTQTTTTNNKAGNINYIEKLLAIVSALGKDTFILNFDEENWKLSRYDSIRRRSDHCYLNIISILNISATQLSKFSQLTTWRHGAITLKDVDYYIFLTTQDLVEPLLLTRETLKIKYKIVLAINANNLHNSSRYNNRKSSENEPVKTKPSGAGGSTSSERASLRYSAVKTACFYCNNGKPTIVTLPIHYYLSKLAAVEEENQTMTEYDYLLIRNKTVDILYPDFVRNFHGYKIRAAVSSKIVYRIEIYFDATSGIWQGKPGVHTRMIELCKTKMNFTYELFPSIGGGGSGVKWPNGTWTGSMADILYDNAEFGMVTAQTLQRDELVSFSFPLTYDWLTFATGIPKPIHTWKAIFWPLSEEVWLCLIPACIGTIISIISISKGANKVRVMHLHQSKNQVGQGHNQHLNVNLPHIQNVQDHKQYQSNNNSVSLFQSSWYVMASFLDQYFIEPETISLKFVCSFWLLFVLIVSTAYRSMLVSCLAFPFVEKAPETFEQLIESNYKWGLYYLAGAAYSAFRSSTNPTYVKIFKGMEIEHSSVNCLVRAINSNFGCIIYEGSAVDVGYRNLSDRYGRHPITVAPTTTFFISSCWVMEKRAIFRTNFEKIMHFSMDIGLNGKWVAMNYERIRDERPKDAKNKKYDFFKDDGPVALGYSNFTGPFYLLLVGCSLSAILLLYEISGTIIHAGIRFYRGIFSISNRIVS